MSAPAATTTPGRLAYQVLLSLKATSGIARCCLAGQVGREVGGRHRLLLCLSQVAHGDRASLPLGGTIYHAPACALVGRPAKLLAKLRRPAQVHARAQPCGPGLASQRERFCGEVVGEDRDGDVYLGWRA